MPDASSGPSESAQNLVQHLFSISLNLESARSIIGDGPAGDRLAAATAELDQVVCDIRNATFGPTPRPAAHQRERLARTARAMLEGALRNADMLEQQARRAEQPTRVDYETEIKRWRSYADQASQMLKRWEHPASDSVQDGDVRLGRTWTY